MRDELLLVFGVVLGAGCYYLGEHSSSHELIRSHYDQFVALQKERDQEHEGRAQCMQHTFDLCPKKFDELHDLKSQH